MNDWRAGIKRIPLHLAGFGLPFGLLVWFGGWSGAAVLLAWRAYEEYLDWHQGRDTWAKSYIDLASQALVPIWVALWRAHL